MAKKRKKRKRRKRRRKKRKKRKRRRSRIALAVFSATLSLSIPISLSLSPSTEENSTRDSFFPPPFYSAAPLRGLLVVFVVVFPHPAGNDARARNLVHTRAIPDTRLILPPLVNRQPLNNRAIPFFFVSSSSIWRIKNGATVFFFFFLLLYFSFDSSSFFFLAAESLFQKRDLRFIFSILEFLSFSSFVIE